VISKAKRESIVVLEHQTEHAGLPVLDHPPHARDLIPLVMGHLSENRDSVPQRIELEQSLAIEIQTSLAAVRIEIQELTNESDNGVALRIRRQILLPAVR
jgi:hypothetical protein